MYDIMNLNRIITEAINNTLLRKYAAKLEKNIGLIRNSGVVPRGNIYNFLNNFNQYCNDITLSIRQNNIEPNQNQAQNTFYGGGYNRKYGNDLINKLGLYNKATSVGLDLHLFNGVWNKGKEWYDKTVDHLTGGDNMAQGMTLQSPNKNFKTAPLKTLINEKDMFKKEFSNLQATMNVGIANIVSDSLAVIENINVELNR
jgi:hypothetical protein